MGSRKTTPPAESPAKTESPAAAASPAKSATPSVRSKKSTPPAESPARSGDVTPALSESSLPAPAPRPAAPEYRRKTLGVNPTLKAAAATYIGSTLSRGLLVQKLQDEVAGMVEEGAIYRAPAGAQVVAWRMRYVYCTDAALCVQAVTRKFRPRGKVRAIPWAKLCKVEALIDDTVYVETTAAEKNFFKIKSSASAAVATWQWATYLCQLSQLMGNEVQGYVAAAAYGVARNDFIDAPLPGGGLRSERLPRLADAEDDEGEGEDESPEEEFRRRQWVLYYVANAQYDEAEDIGWDGLDPPDPRLETATNASSSGIRPAGPPIEDKPRAASKKGKGGGKSGRKGFLSLMPRPGRASARARAPDDPEAAGLLQSQPSGGSSPGEGSPARFPAVGDRL